MTAPQQQRSNDRFENYVPVAERIEQFYEKFQTGRINTTILEHDRETGFVLIRAEVFRSPDDAMPAATGHAYEVRSEGYVNKNSYVENCETGAVGRALALLGFEVKRGIASREEMQKPQRQTSAPSRIVTAPDGPKDVRAIPPTEDAQLVEDSMNILEAASKLGYDGTKVRKWVNQKYQVAEGINSLNPHDRKEVLRLFREQGQTVGVPPTGDAHTAKSMADLVSPKQLGLIRSLARERELDPDNESQRLMGCKIEELSKRSASEFIDHLKPIDVVTS